MLWFMKYKGSNRSVYHTLWYVSSQKISEVLRQSFQENKKMFSLCIKKLPTIMYFERKTEASGFWSTGCLIISSGAIKQVNLFTYT